MMGQKEREKKRKFRGKKVNRSGNRISQRWTECTNNRQRLANRFNTTFGRKKREKEKRVCVLAREQKEREEKKRKRELENEWTSDEESNSAKQKSQMLHCVSTDNEQYDMLLGLGGNRKNQVDLIDIKAAGKEKKKKQ